MKFASIALGVAAATNAEDDKNTMWYINGLRGFHQGFMDSFYHPTATQVATSPVAKYGGSILNGFLNSALGSAKEHKLDKVESGDIDYSSLSPAMKLAMDHMKEMKKKETPVFGDNQRGLTDCLD